MTSDGFNRRPARVAWGVGPAVGTPAVGGAFRNSTQRRSGGDGGVRNLFACAVTCATHHARGQDPRRGRVAPSWSIGEKGLKNNLWAGVRPHVDQVLVMAAPSFAPDGTFSIWTTCATVGFALARSWADIRRLCGRVRRAVVLRRLSTSREAGVLREYRFARRAIPRGRCCARSVAVLGLPV